MNKKIYLLFTVFIIGMIPGCLNITGMLLYPPSDSPRLYTDEELRTGFVAGFIGDMAIGFALGYDPDDGPWSSENNRRGFLLGLGIITVDIVFGSIIDDLLHPNESKKNNKAKDDTSEYIIIPPRLMKVQIR